LISRWQVAGRASRPRSISLQLNGRTARPKSRPRRPQPERHNHRRAGSSQARHAQPSFLWRYVSGAAL